MSATKAEYQSFKVGLAGTHQTDWTIKVNGYEWKVHGSILIRKSKFFEKLCCSNFRESTEKCVTLHDDNPWIVARMIRWFYVGSVDFAPAWDFETPEWEGPSVRLPLEELMSQRSKLPEFDNEEEIDSERPHWHTISMLYMIANKYEIPNLMAATQEKMEDYIRLSGVLVSDLIRVLGPATLEHNEAMCESLVTVELATSSDILSTIDGLNKLFSLEPKLERIMQHAIAKKLADAQRFNHELSLLLNCNPVTGQLRDKGVSKRLSGINDDLPDFINKRPRFG